VLIWIPPGVRVPSGIRSFGSSGEGFFFVAPYNDQSRKRANIGRGVMWRKLIAVILMFALPAGASAGPLKEAIEKAGARVAAAQPGVETRSRARFWSSIALMAAGGVMTALGSVELGDDDDGPDDAEDMDDSDDGEDSDGWGSKALVGGGIASAALGGVLFVTGRKSGPVMTVRPGSVTVRQILRF
jgi:hypothetical protein